MTIGEHLDELRVCVIRALAALVISSLICIWPAGSILKFIARPALIVLHDAGYETTFLATGPAEGLIIFIKTVVIAGVTISGPYILYQLWTFIAAGLYPGEKRWVVKLLPPSVGLFLAGVAFMYTLILPLSMKFLVGVNAWFPMPSLNPSAFDRLLLNIHTPAAASQPASAPSFKLQEVNLDPASTNPGDVWINVPERQLKIRGDEDTYLVPLQREGHQSLIAPHFRINEYLSFVLGLTLAFGAAFQMPLVVIFLARTNIAPVQTLRSYRKFVILAIVVIAGFIAPPDLLSHLLLSGPMILLFEIGLLIAARTSKPSTQRA